jgi:hypothetical protein
LKLYELVFLLIFRANEDEYEAEADLDSNDPSRADIALALGVRSCLSLKTRRRKEEELARAIPMMDIF